MVMVEAMACGTPVAALSGAGGPDELIEDRVNGLLCTKENYEERILEFVETTGTPEEILQKLETFSDNETYRDGVAELQTVVQTLKKLGVSQEQFVIDLRVARGLDYYTGTVYETHLIGNESLGSVCSGGRYDDLTGVFTGKKMPGVGISIGLTRLLWQLFESKLVETTRGNDSDIIIISRDSLVFASSLHLGKELRQKGFRVEVYMEDKKIQKQFEYAKKMGIPCRIIVGEDDTVVECEDLEFKSQIENLI